jgi:predicted AAA+ superfamily ATPase
MIHRIINIPLSNSFFLFGARGTGKTNLLSELFAGVDALKYDLLEDSVVRRLGRKPESLRSEFLAKSPKWQWVVLDEVQRVPSLLNIAHKMIETDAVKFALTGSSARKLKRGGGNLLAGRAFVYHLYPLTSVELADRFSLMEALTYGTLPKLTLLPSNSDKQKYLESYASTYVKEEIVAEQVVRRLEPFRDFLQISAQMSSKIINHTKIAKEVGADPKTVMTYFDILEETHMGFRLPAYHVSIRKAQRVGPKFYWFDCGVRRALEDTLIYPPAPGTSYFGDLFEEFVVNEFVRMSHYSGKNYQMSYLSTHNSETEIDLILRKGRGHELIAIEIKSSASVDETEVRKLARAARDCGAKKIYYLSQCEHTEVIDGVRCIHWQKALLEIMSSRV